MDLHIPRYTPLPHIIHDERRRRKTIRDERPAASPPPGSYDPRDKHREPVTKEAYEISLV